MYILFENTFGYFLFFCLEDFSLQIKASKWEIFIQNYNDFFNKIKFRAFIPFKTMEHALKNFLLLSKSCLSNSLSEFLFTQIKINPQKFLLGIEDSKLGTKIYEKNNIKVISNELVIEIIRGIRLHFDKFIQNFVNFGLRKNLSNIAFFFCQSKMSLNFRKTDTMVVQSNSLLELIEKDLNLFSMIIKEWYSKHFPELFRILPNNYLFAIAVKFIGDKKRINFKKEKELGILIMNRKEAKKIVEASKTSVGSKLSPYDLSLIENLSSKILLMLDFKNQLIKFLNRKLKYLVPNLVTLLGENMTAQLIAGAGSLKNLVKFPSSTIQLLGAEKSLFQALKKRTKTPKFGLLFNSSFILKTSHKNKGKISRFLANKCSLAAKIDYFSLFSTSLYGKKLRNQLKDIMQFWKTGDMGEI